MRLRIWSIPAFLALSRVVLADIEIITPGADAVLKGGDPITVEWEHSGNFSSFSESTQYDVFLCAGGNSQDGYVRNIRRIFPVRDMLTLLQLCRTNWHLLCAAGFCPMEIQLWAILMQPLEGTTREHSIFSNLPFPTL